MKTVLGELWTKIYRIYGCDKCILLWYSNVHKNFFNIHLYSCLLDKDTFSKASENSIYKAANEITEVYVPIRHCIIKCIFGSDTCDGRPTMKKLMYARYTLFRNYQTETISESSIVYLNKTDIHIRFHVSWNRMFQNVIKTFFALTLLPWLLADSSSCPQRWKSFSARLRRRSEHRERIPGTHLARRETVPVADRGSEDLYVKATRDVCHDSEHMGERW